MGKKCVYYHLDSDEPIEIEFDWEKINRINRKLGLPEWYPDDYKKEIKDRVEL